MSAIPKEFLDKAAALSEEATRPFPKSCKIYVQGSRADIQVGMREVRQTPTRSARGVGQKRLADALRQAGHDHARDGIHRHPRKPAPAGAGSRSALQEAAQAT